MRRASCPAMAIQGLHDSGQHVGGKGASRGARGAFSQALGTEPFPSSVKQSQASCCLPSLALNDWVNICSVHQEMGAWAGTGVDSRPRMCLGWNGNPGGGTWGPSGPERCLPFSKYEAGTQLGSSGPKPGGGGGGSSNSSTSRIGGGGRSRGGGSSGAGRENKVCPVHREPPPLAPGNCCSRGGHPSCPFYEIFLQPLPSLVLPQCRQRRVGAQ